MPVEMTRPVSGGSFNNGVLIRRQSLVRSGSICPTPMIGALGHELANSFPRQIRVAKNLGLDFIDLSTTLLLGADVGDKQVNVADLADLHPETFDALVGAVKAANIPVSCLATNIADATTSIDTDLNEVDIPRLRRALKLAQALDVPNLRIFSWKASDEVPLQTVIDRVSQLVRIVTDESEDVVLLHECYGKTRAGRKAKDAVDLIEGVASPRLKLLIDPGNRIETQDALAYWQATSHYTAGIHIKDGRLVGGEGQGKVEYTLPGQGEAAILPILTDLFRNNWLAPICMEQRIAFNTTATPSDEDLKTAAFLAQGHLDALLVKVAEGLG